MIGQFIPGIYCIAVYGELPPDIEDYLQSENYGYRVRSKGQEA